AIPTTMPFIVMIADEIADMMMTAGKEIEAHIIRLAQKSRAVGIHLILATQKPTVDVITGLIKSNLPARIAFQVASRTDSRVVLDEMGAERLLGNGDMLFLSPGTSQILRGQGTFLSDEEIGRVMATIGTSEPQYAAELVNLQPAGPAAEGEAKPGGSPKDKDDLYEAAVEVVIREGRGSVSLLQRALGVGYGRGARLIDFMAEDGIVGEYKGSQAREVLVTMEEWAARTGTAPLPPDPAPRKLKIQPHAHEQASFAVEDETEEWEDDASAESFEGDESADDDWEEEDDADAGERGGPAPQPQKRGSGISSR
ncbi:MAG: DNA translocase FtsK, partial [Planctomycetota bacterium]